MSKNPPYSEQSRLFRGRHHHCPLKVVHQTCQKLSSKVYFFEPQILSVALRLSGV